MSKIIVPSDFSSTSDVAVKYACEISKTLSSEVHILHILKAGADETETQSKLSAQIKQSHSNTGVTARAIVRHGEILDEIPKVTEETNAELVVMGIKLALTQYQLPIDPDEVECFDEFHERYGKYINAAQQA